MKIQIKISNFVNKNAREIILPPSCERYLGPFNNDHKLANI